MSEKNIVRKTAEEIEQMESRTDWERVDALTDEEIEAAVAEDPDAELLDAEWFERAELVVPSTGKTCIDLDEYVVAHFKRQGGDYQARINDVLKGYVLGQQLQEQRDALNEDATDG